MKQTTYTFTYILLTLLLLALVVLLYIYIQVVWQKQSEPVVSDTPAASEANGLSEAERRDIMNIPNPDAKTVDSETRTALMNTANESNAPALSAEERAAIMSQ